MGRVGMRVFAAFDGCVCRTSTSETGSCSLGEREDSRQYVYRIPLPHT